MRSIVAKNKQVLIVNGAKPTIKPSYLLIETLYSAISPGTEQSIIGQSGDVERNLGYSAVGVVVECGDGIEDYQVGDIVTCYGAPYVEHSEYLLVPVTLCAKVPSTMNVKAAALGGIGAIAIHALRVAKLSFGESVVVVGLGLLGQMIAKIARAAAYDVIAYDLHEQRAEMLAAEINIPALSTLEDLESEIHQRTNGHGVDAVLLCAGGKRSPLTGQSLNWIRKQGKVVIIGDIEPDFPRNVMFGKEAQILISRAGGPGRYDPVFEKEAIDYPYGYVRWTEGRNVAEYVRLVTEQKIDVQSFITDEVHLEDATAAHDDLRHKQSTTLTKIIKYK